jgi:glycosyltransferase involved in cell wall biosynthesis
MHQPRSLRAVEADTWPSRIGIINDYIRIPYANGSSFASQHLYRSFSDRGHEVVVMGPDDGGNPNELPARHVALPSLPFRMHPGVFLPFPSKAALARAAAADLDVVLGQAGSALLEMGVWLRRVHRVPLLCVNTIHLPSVFTVVLPDCLHRVGAAKTLLQSTIVPWLEQQFVKSYNESDGLIVLSAGLRDYWHDRGVRVPIHIIPRAIERKVFDAPSHDDPFPRHMSRGQRLLVVCRHTREKSVDRLLRIFATLIAPAAPDACLALVGDGPEHQALKDLASELGIEHRVHFAGEQRLTEMVDWYRHADVFVYASLSETYGQVVSEALWCGLPAVAFADGMGVSHQIDDGETGTLVSPGPDEDAANWRFANAALALLRDPARRAALGATARANALERCDPSRTIARYYEAFDSARRHIRTSAPLSWVGSLTTQLRLVRWAYLHLLIAASGYVRPPVVVNRNGRRQPGWEELRREEPALVPVARATARRPQSLLRLHRESIDELDAALASRPAATR